MGSGATKYRGSGDPAPPKVMSDTGTLPGINADISTRTFRLSPQPNVDVITSESTPCLARHSQQNEPCVSGLYQWDSRDVAELLGTAEVSIPEASSTDARLEHLEQLVHAQAQELQELRQALACVRKDARRTVSVLQYNILASYLGRNTLPWFLYGAEVTSESRAKVFKKYLERQEDGQPAYSWPGYVEDILSPHEIALVEAQDDHFRWEHRRDKLASQIRDFDADVVSLVENDQHHFFSQTLADRWDSVFHKRPRECSLDGCSVFWRRSKFHLRAWEGFDYVDALDDKGRERKDRSCLMVLLKWQGSNSSLVAVSTHLAKDPDNRSQTAIRVRQVSQLVERLTAFTGNHGAKDAPVVLLGDLNARHFGEIRGITRTVWQIKGSNIHKFLWSASDVPTGPTSITNARQCRIDCVQFMSSQLEVLEVGDVPQLPMGVAIPNDEHPSDHLPVYVEFQLKDSWLKHKECARAWLECVAGREKLHPLTEEELRIAFDFFDRDCTSIIDADNLEEACLDLHVRMRCDVQKLLLDCFPDRHISYDNFIRAYEARLSHERMRCVGELERAFHFFAGESRTLGRKSLEDAFREITPVSFSDEEVKDMLERININDSEKPVDLKSFCEIVSNVNFPHRDRRRNSLFEVPNGHDTRSLTKDMRLKLNHLDSMLRRQVSPASATGLRLESSRS